MSYCPVKSDRGATGRMDAPTAEYVYERVVTLLDDGWSDKQAARRMGVSDKAVRAFRTRYGIRNSLEREPLEATSRYHAVP